MPFVVLSHRSTLLCSCAGARTFDHRRHDHHRIARHWCQPSFLKSFNRLSMAVRGVREEPANKHSVGLPVRYSFGELEVNGTIEITEGKK